MAPHLNLLFIEDGADNSATVLRDLPAAGYEIHTVTVQSAAGLRNVLETDGWDLIIADHPGSRLNLLEALEIRKQSGQNVPFIVVSGAMSEEMAVEAIRVGATDIVMKDHLSRLIPTIERVLRDSAGEKEHRQMERVQAALIELSQETLDAKSLEDLYQTIHRIISGLMPAQNFYISIYDEQTEMISFPYYIDEYDTSFPPEKLGRGLTAYVMRSGKPLLASPEVFNDLVARGEVVEEGAPSIDWLGVPLKHNSRPVGVLAVQSYTEGVRFTLDDQKILEFVSTQIAMAIHRKRGEEALKAESRFRKAIEDSILAGVVVTDLEGRQSYVNPAFCRMVGWDEKELLGALPPFVYWPEEEIENIQEAMAVATGEDGIPGDFELRYKRKNGERFDAYLLLSPLTGEDGKVTGWLSSVNDITARKSNEEAVRRQKNRAESLARTAARLNARLDLQSVLNTVCQETTRAFSNSGAALFLYDSDEDSFILAAREGLPAGSQDKLASISRSMIEPLFNSRDGAIRVRTFAEIPGMKDTDFVRESGLSSGMVSMMESAKKMIGMLGVFAIDGKVAYQDDELSLLEGLSDLAIQAILNARMFSEIERRLDQLHALHAVDLAISASMDLRITLNIMLDHVTRLLNVDAADVLLFNSGAQELEYCVGRGFRTSYPARSRQRLRNGYAGKVVVERNQVQVANLLNTNGDAEFRQLAERESLNAYLGVPLIAKGQVKGVLEIMSRTSLRPTADWLEMVEAMAGQAAIAIDNATLFDQLQRTNEELISAYDSTLEGWTRAMELRDGILTGHTQRVIDLTMQLARRVGMREDEMVDLRRGALLHDIGNIGIPDRILKKNTKLNDEEWEIVQQHPVFAYQMMAPIAYLRPAIDIPYCHHEKWDGSGYPRGLAGEQIPLAARIFSIVDVWDALLSDRPYRRAWSPKEAVEYIAAQAGISFEPQIVRSFLGLI